MNTWCPQPRSSMYRSMINGNGVAFRVHRWRLGDDRRLFHPNPKRFARGGRSDGQKKFRLLALCFRCCCLPSHAIFIARHVSVQVFVVTISVPMHPGDFLGLLLISRPSVGPPPRPDDFALLLIDWGECTTFRGASRFCTESHLLLLPPIPPHLNFQS